MKTLSLTIICLIISCSENLSDPEELIKIPKINLAKINQASFGSTISNIDQIRFEFLINDLKQSNLYMDDFVSTKWSSDKFGQLKRTFAKTLGNNIFSLSLPTGIHQITLTVETIDTIFADETTIEVTDFTNFPIIHQDSDWVNYQSANIRHILVDKNNNKWFASGGIGIVKFNNNNFKPINDYKLNNSGSSIDQSFDIQSIALDPTFTTIYAGHLSKSYVTKIENDSANSFQIDPSNESNDIHSILVDSNELLWIGLHFGEFVKFDLSNENLEEISIKPNAFQINYLGFDLNRNIIGGGLFRHIFLYDRISWSEFLDGPRYQTILYDDFQTLWAASTSGLVRYDGNESITYSVQNSGIPANLVRDIAFDKFGNIWLATQNGVAKFDQQNWTYYNTVTSPIISDDTQTIAIDSTNQIWIGTPIGFSVFKGNQL